MDNNYDIFKYLKPLENTKLSDYKGYDFIDMLDVISKYYLEYRDKLFVTNRTSIGCEIEFQNKENSLLIPKKDEDYEIQPGWILREDGSIPNGGEIISPIFYNNKSSWKDFKEFFKIFDENIYIDDMCSSHVHIGTQIMGSEPITWNRFLKLWQVYENVIFRFCYGEYLNSRGATNKYCPPIAKKINTYFRDMINEYGRYYDEKTIMPTREFSFQDKFTKERYHAVNFCNISNYESFQEYNTIEFRLANGTLNPIIWQNLINFYLAFITYAKRNNYDNDTIAKRSSKRNYNSKLDTYNKLYYDEAIELCDLIFSKNIDKIYFLRQYIKDSQVSYHQTLVKSKKFTI